MGEGESAREEERGRERRAGEGARGSTRRKLRAIYALEEQDLSSSSHDDYGESSSAAGDGGLDDEE